MNSGLPIPGQTPLDDLSGLRAKRVRTTAELNAAEAENIRKAIVKYLIAKPTRRAARFDVLWMLKLHREMFGDVWTWAGTLRKRDTNIGSPPRRIETDLHELVADLRAWESSGMRVLEQAVRLHHLSTNQRASNGLTAPTSPTPARHVRGKPITDAGTTMNGSAHASPDAMNDSNLRC